MFGWLRRLFESPPPRRDPRSVFEFWDGTRERAVDPIEVWHRLDSLSGGKWQEWLRTIATPAPPVPPGCDPARFDTIQEVVSKARREAMHKVGEMATAVFGVGPIEGAGEDKIGLTLLERIALVASYLDHMAQLAEGAKAHPPSGSLSATA